MFIQARKGLNPLYSFQNTTGEIYFPYGSKTSKKNGMNKHEMWKAHAAALQ